MFTRWLVRAALPVPFLLFTLAHLGFGQARNSSTSSAQRRLLLDSAKVMAATPQAREALPLLRRAVDPSLGQRDDTWSASVQLLARLLIEGNDAEEAQAWLRWALRMAPGLRLQPGDSAFEAAVTAARTFVGGQPAQAPTALRFDWTTGPTPPGLGTIRLEAGPTLRPEQLQAEIAGIGFLDPARPRRLTPGSYLVSLRAPGLPETSVNTEVLPGVTTTLSANVFIAVAVSPPQPVPPTMPPKKKGGRSKFVILGGLAAGGLVAALSGGGGGGDKPTTGGITIRLP